MPDFEGGIERSGKTDGLHHNWCIELDDGLGRSPRRFRPDAAADQHGTLVLEELVFSAIVFALDRPPMFDERTHLALEGGDDRDFGGVRHIRFYVAPASCRLSRGRLALGGWADHENSATSPNPAEPLLGLTGSHRLRSGQARAGPHGLTYAYPFAWNHSTARRKASSTGTVFHPSSRSALPEDTNIFFRPMRTASIVARGSRLRM